MGDRSDFTVLFTHLFTLTASGEKILTSVMPTHPVFRRVDDRVCRLTLPAPVSSDEAIRIENLEPWGRVYIVERREDRPETGYV